MTRRRPSTLRIALCLALGLSLSLAGCASSQDRSPWHQYLHDHGLE